MLENKDVLRVLKIKVDELESARISDSKIESLNKLDAERFEVRGDCSYSEQGYVTVANPKTGREIVVSKDGAGRTKVFGNNYRLGKWDESFNTVSKKIDFIGYLNKPMYKKYTPNRSKVDEYKRLKKVKEIYSRELEKSREQYEKDLMEFEKTISMIEALKE